MCHTRSKCEFAAEEQHNTTMHPAGLGAGIVSEEVGRTAAGGHGLSLINIPAWRLGHTSSSAAAPNARNSSAAASESSTSSSRTSEAAEQRQKQKDNPLWPWSRHRGPPPRGFPPWGDGPAGPGFVVSLALPTALPPDPSKRYFRYWIDYQVLSSPESAVLLERALMAVGGRKVGGPPKLDPVTAMKQKLKDYGYMHMDAWDFLWSITAKAMLAAEILRPGQLVAIVPGFLSITRKTSLVRSLRSMYGDDAAFTIVPRTFKLPDEMDEWEAWINAHPKEDTGLWMLKNNKQRGTGLRLVRTHEAFNACFETTTRPGLEGLLLYRWYLAQQYIADPMLINGHKFGIRVWVLVPDVAPLRVYLHCNGLVLFSDQRYDVEETKAEEEGGLPPGHVTNYAQNENGPVWSLSQLKTHLGASRFARLWSQIERSVAMTFVSALPRAKEVQASMSLPPRSCFQFFGLDFLLDAALKPWLLEANATPSMKVQHAEPALERLIHDQKWPVVRDMVAMMGICPDRFNPAVSEHRDLRFMTRELQSRGGFAPLMHLFPEETPEGLRLIPWGPLDVQMRTFVQGRAYQQVLQECCGSA